MSNVADRSDAKPSGFVPAEAVQQGFGEYIGNWLRRVRAGDLGSLPIIIGLFVIAIIFGTLEPVFFRERNFVNLLLQMSGITAIAIGIVFVLLIAEIDLSVAFVSGVGGVTMTLLLREEVTNWPWPFAIGAALLATTSIGLIHGLIITKAGVPSFVVTLAGLLAWSGVVLILTTQYSNAGTIVIQDDVVLGIANRFLPQTWGWILFVLIVGGYTVSQLSQQQSLRRQSLATKPSSIVALQILGLAVIAGGAVWYANRDRGVPVVAVIILCLLVGWSFIATRTRFGRYVYAIGGNPEAARRAGISVDNIRIAVFMISGFMSGVGGIILASRLRSVDTNTGSGNLLLNAIAAAVIGGTSLFGGSGRVMSAFLGALIIAGVENGMGLLGLPSGVKFVVTGGVLLAAVLIDAFSRRSRASSGIA
ncbi:MAG: ABC transporter permease [Chloroflexota bacterium]